MLLVHVRNVTGLGASQVVSSLVHAIVKLKSMPIVFIPSHQESFSMKKDDNIECVHVKSMLPNALFRFAECLFPKLFYPCCDKTLVLGDIPLRGMNEQVVFMHQSNLIKPSVNVHSSKHIMFKIMRILFQWNLKDVKWLVVQSGVMCDELVLSYPSLIGKIKVIPQPAPDWFLNIECKKRSAKGGLTLFYPAAGYPHKNHQFIQLLAQEGLLDEDVKELIVTLRKTEVDSLSLQGLKVKNVGRLSPHECMDHYGQADALFFPSLAESYGLPLIEAMTAGLPVLCADLPYAHWMCEGEAIYFDPQDVNSAALAIKELNKRLASGWKPNWSQALSKFPDSWDEVAQNFIELLQ